jgi:uncharacterized peroxidase-related enzyme
MPRLPIVTEEAASLEVSELFSDFRRKMGFPAAPNFITVQGASAPVLRGTWGLVQNVLVAGSLPRSLKEMVFVAISNDRNCKYCTAAHLACCRMLGVDARNLDQLVVNVEELMPETTRDIIMFSIKCSRTPQELTEEDFNSIRRHGLTDSEVTEVIAMSGLAVYANIIADATEIKADNMFGEI